MKPSLFEGCHGEVSRPYGRILKCDHLAKLGIAEVEGWRICEAAKVGTGSKNGTGYVSVYEPCASETYGSAEARPEEAHRILKFRAPEKCPLLEFHAIEETRPLKNESRKIDESKEFRFGEH
ncbi:hypothetical protein AB0B12_11850 [Streptomyces sp. NPDC044780]|uniref:hypothetical protein n=1 Tax=unclassified Streptomyces TaxID=2593676 RepID=UPI0033E29FBC